MWFSLNGSNLIRVFTLQCWTMFAPSTFERIPCHENATQYKNNELAPSDGDKQTIKTCTGNGMKQKKLKK